MILCPSELPKYLQQVLVFLKLRSQLGKICGVALEEALYYLGFGIWKKYKLSPKLMCFMGSNFSFQNLVLPCNYRVLKSALEQ